MRFSANSPHALPEYVACSYCDETTLSDDTAPSLDDPAEVVCLDCHDQQIEREERHRDAVAAQIIDDVRERDEERGIGSYTASCNATAAAQRWRDRQPDLDRAKRTRGAA